jgi:hypothetical protein
VASVLIKARRLTALAFLASLTALAGAAWACGPSFGPLAVSPSQGQPGSKMTVSGSGFHDGSVEIRWNGPNGPLLATASGHDFSVRVTVPDVNPGVYYVVARPTGPNSGTAPYSTAPFRVTERPSLSVSPASGRVAGRASVTGSLFPSEGPVRLHWDSPAGPLLATAAGPSFTTSITVPAAAPGAHRIVALSPELWSGLTPAATQGFGVTAPPAGLAVPPPAPDAVGPSIAAAALSLANRIRRVSRRGYFTLFCGRFSEEPVTGRCGARGARRAGPRLRSKPFQARKGRMVRVRLRLSGKGLASLERAGKMRMRGHVAARDRLGNRSAAGFRFMLRAPQGSGRTARRADAAVGW